MAKLKQDTRVILIQPTGLTLFKNLAEATSWQQGYADRAGKLCSSKQFLEQSWHAELCPFVPGAIGRSREELWQLATQHAMSPEDRAHWLSLDAVKPAKPVRVREGVGVFIERLIGEGFTNEEIWKQAQPRFNLTPAQRYYPSWYRGKLRRQGASA